MTLTGSPSPAMAAVAASTAAAPLMSHFIVSMDFGGLSDRPPESNVMPFPTKTTVLRRLRVGVLKARPGAADGRTPGRRP